MLLYIIFAHFYVSCILTPCAHFNQYFEISANCNNQFFRLNSDILFDDIFCTVEEITTWMAFSLNCTPCSWRIGEFLSFRALCNNKEDNKKLEPQVMPSCICPNVLYTPRLGCDLPPWIRAATCCRATTKCNGTREKGIILHNWLTNLFGSVELRPD